MAEKTLYERLGGVFAIAAVVDHFSDEVVKNPIVGGNGKTVDGMAYIRIQEAYLQSFLRSSDNG